MRGGAFFNGKEGRDDFRAMITSHPGEDPAYWMKKQYIGTDCTAIAIYSPNSLILCSSFKEQTSSCPFFSATI